MLPRTYRGARHRVGGQRLRSVSREGGETPQISVVSRHLTSAMAAAPPSVMRFTHDDKAWHLEPPGARGSSLLITACRRETRRRSYSPSRHVWLTTGQPEARPASERHYCHFYLLKRRLARLPGLRNASSARRGEERSPTNTSRRSSLPPQLQRGSNYSLPPRSQTSD